MNSKLIALLTVFMLCISAEAFAQTDELFQSPEERPVPTELEKLLDEVPEETTEEPTPTSIEDFANQYYKNCLRKDHEKLNEEAMEMLCACTAAKMPEEMTLKDAYAMQRNSSEGRLQRVRFMEFVYIPCIDTPTEITIRDRCLANKEITKRVRNDYAVCSCMGKKMGKFMAEQAKKNVGVSLRRRMEEPDPFDYLFDGKYFGTIFHRESTACQALYK